MTLTTIYVQLPDEAVEVWAPVDAEPIGGLTYRIVDCRGEDDEVQFGRGAVVRCQHRLLGTGLPDTLELVAVERVG